MADVFGLQIGGALHRRNDTGSRRPAPRFVSSCLCVRGVWSCERKPRSPKALCRCGAALCSRKQQHYRRKSGTLLTVHGASWERAVDPDTIAKANSTHMSRKSKSPNTHVYVHRCTHEHSHGQSPFRTHGAHTTQAQTHEVTLEAHRHTL